MKLQYLVFQVNGLEKWPRSSKRIKYETGKKHDLKVGGGGGTPAPAPTPMTLSYDTLLCIF